MSAMRAEVAVGTLAEIVDDIPRKFRNSRSNVADMSLKVIGISTSTETIRNGGRMSGSTLENAAQEPGTLVSGSANTTPSRPAGLPAAVRLSALFESGDSLEKRRSCSEVTDEVTSTTPVSNIEPVTTGTDAKSTYVTSVTVTKTKSSEPSKDTHVVKSVYTTKTGNSTRVFTVETTTDSVTRKISMAGSTGALPSTPSIVNQQPIVASPSDAVQPRESFHGVVPAVTITEEDSDPATRSEDDVCASPLAHTPEDHGSHAEAPSDRLTQNEDFPAPRRGGPSTSSKTTPPSEEHHKMAGNEQRKGLAKMQFCNFLFRKERVRPRIFRPRRDPPVQSSPASSPPASPSSPLLTSSAPAHGDVCVAVVAAPLEASSVEVIDHRSKNIEQILETLKKGTQLWKIRSFTKWYRRSYYLDDKEGTVRYEPSHKAPCMNSPLKIAIDDIIDVRKGWKTDTFNKIEQKVERRRIKFPSQPSPVDERCCFSIIYSNNKQSLDLCAPEPKVADMWVRGLRHILTALKGLHQEERFERWLEQQFYEADVDKNNGLNFEESLKLLKHLNVKMPRSSVKKIFDEANTVKHSKNGEQVIDADEFVSFYMKLMSRSEIKEIYLRYCKNNKEMTAVDLMDFIHKEQKGHDTTKEECLSLIEAFEQSNLKAEGKISLIGFTNMLMSEQFDVLKQHHKVVYQDMHQPLSHYYIATSHNTYLTGNQLHGESSVEGYIDALKQGCRCVELDCWDGPDGEPIIYHGYTLTSKILFKDVLVDAIKPYAFHASEYPVILSLENHLSPKQQEILTKHLIGVLGDMLYTKPVHESMEFLPSPEDLKHKVIVKAKKKSSRSVEDGEESNSEDEITSPPSIESTKIDIKKVKAEVISGLSSLVNVCEAVHFHSFEDTEANKKCYQMSSFSEAKANKFIETKGREFVNYNTKHLSRIYPAGTRTDSSNFKPIPYWNMGCQLVALNYQHSGKPMLYNDAKFQDNGGCGFVLKPEYLRKKGYDPESTLNDRNQVTLKLTVISGQHIPKADQDTDGEIVDPYVKVKIIGHPRDNQKLKTEAVRNNGFNPIWNNEMTFNIKMPELAMIHFSVKDLSNTGKDVTLGTYAIPFLSLQEGYSHVYLKDYFRNYVSPASLFIHVCVI